jgi:hypothetical protein
MNHVSAKPPDPLAPLYGKLPAGWEAWVSAFGILYARRRQSGPSEVVRSTSAEDLAAQVHQAEGRLR